MFSTISELGWGDALHTWTPGQAGAPQETRPPPAGACSSRLTRRRHRVCRRRDSHGRADSLSLSTVAAVGSHAGTHPSSQAGGSHAAWNQPPEARQSSWWGQSYVMNSLLAWLVRESGRRRGQLWPNKTLLRVLTSAHPRAPPGRQGRRRGVRVRHWQLSDDKGRLVPEGTLLICPDVVHPIRPPRALVTVRALLAVDEVAAPVCTADAHGYEGQDSQHH